MTDEQIARLSSAMRILSALDGDDAGTSEELSNYLDTHGELPSDTATSAAAEYLRLLPHIKAVCEAQQALDDYDRDTDGSLHELANAIEAEEQAIAALVSAVKEGE